MCLTLSAEVCNSPVSVCTYTYTYTVMVMCSYVLADTNLCCRFASLFCLCVFVSATCSTDTCIYQ